MWERAGVGGGESLDDRSDAVDQSGVDAVRHGWVASGPAERLDPNTFAGGHVAALLLDDDDAVRVRHAREDTRALGPRGLYLPAIVGVPEDAPLELTPTRLLPHRLEGDRMEARREQLAAPGDLVECRTHEEMEREHACDRVAGEPEEVRRADASDGDRAAGLHGHLPEIDPAHVLKDGLDEIVVADRYTARREHDMRSLRRLDQVLAQLFEDVRDDAMVRDLCSCRLRNAAQREPVGVVDLAGLALEARLDHCVARGEDGHPRALAHQQLRQTQRLCHTEILRAEDGSNRQDHRPGFHVFATLADVGAALDRWNEKMPAFAGDDLLGVDGAGSSRHRRARHDADGLA